MEAMFHRAEESETNMSDISWRILALRRLEELREEGEYMYND
jgi:hypothetical protein